MDAKVNNEKKNASSTCWITINGDKNFAFQRIESTAINILGKSGDLVKNQEGIEKGNDGTIVQTQDLQEIIEKANDEINVLTPNLRNKLL